MTSLATDPLPPGTLRLHHQQAAVRKARQWHRYRVLVSGRRWGKSELQKVECIEEFGTPGLVWYIAPTYDMARDVMFEPIRACAPPEWFSSVNQTRMEFETIWGCRFACKSAEHPDRLRGRGVRKLFIDEFQDWVDGLTTWEQVLLPMLLTTQGSALIAGTPKGFNHLHKMWDRGQSGHTDWSDWKSWQFKTADAPHILPAELAKMRAQMDPRSYRQEFEASFETVSGRAYYAFTRASNSLKIEPSRHHAMGITFDFNVNPATGVLWQRVSHEARVWRHIWVEHAGGEATEAATKAAKDHLASIGWRGPIRLYGDPAGQSAKTTGPSDHAVIQKAFPGAEWCIPPSAPHIKDRVAAVNSRCLTADEKVHLYVDPSCQHLINDLEQVTMPMLTDPSEKRKNPMLTHISDAFSYAIHYEWPPVKRGGAAEGYAHWL
jgi:hypothetical protein